MDPILASAKVLKNIFLSKFYAKKDKKIFYFGHFNFNFLNFW